MFTTKQIKKPKFNEGEVVRVKSPDDIAKSIHRTSKTLDGCLFTGQMWDYCDSTHKVLKLVNSFYNERKRRTYKPRSPLYILENLLCEGKVDDFPHKCDHGCFLLWHEEWLEKA